VTLIWVMKIPSFLPAEPVEGAFMTADTLPKLLKQQAEKYGHRKHALREKDYGIWQSFTWQEYYEHVKYFCLGMVALGLERDDKIAIIGDNRPEWIYAELSAQSIGAVPIGIYQDSILKEVSYIINLSRSKIVVAEDQEQCDKILDMLDELPSVEYIIYHDPKGMRTYDEPKLLYFPDVEEMGRRYEEEHPGFYESQVEATSEDDVAAICTTSGTTGNPKLSMLSHKNMVRMAHNLGEVDKKYETDEFVSFLPLPWIGEQMMAISSALLFGFTVNFPEKPETAQENVREIGPHVMFSPPRVWENMAAMVQVKIMDASRFKRFVYNKCLPIGYHWADLKFQKKTPTFMEKLKYFIAYWLVFRALKDRLGFSHIRSASTGGAALGPDTFRFFHALGVNLKQIYGQTEISGISCIHRDGDIDFDTVGIPIPETEIRITEEGEIISRSPSLFLGYYENPEATAETIREKQRLLRRELRRERNIRLSLVHPEETLLEAWLSRGDRRLAEVVYRAWQKGAKFDAWDEGRRFDLWLEAFAEADLDPAFYAHRRRPIDEPFPWDHISVAVRKEFLAQDYLASQQGETRIDCRHRCYACGILPTFADLRYEHPGEVWKCPEVKRPPKRRAPYLPPLPMPEGVGQA